MFVVVAVTGGIAAYKTVHLVRDLVRAGHEVHVVPTADALRFVGLPTWEALSRNPVTTSVHDDVARVRHVSLGQQADLVIVAPTTANTIAKMAAGIADDLLGTTLLATTAPVVIAPAMHTEMWRHPATTANMATLRSRGVIVVGPDDGLLTGGDSGPGRMSEPADILRTALGAVTAPDLEGLRVLVSAGGTREPLDPVRFIGNRSSGRQGVALALAAADRGAEVDLVAAHVEAAVLASAASHPRIHISHVGTAAELQDAVVAAASVADVVVMAAAVSDYRVNEVADTKLTKEGGDGTLTLRLVENPDVLAGLARTRRPGQTIVGFAAETASGDELRERGRRKRERKGADLLVVNRVGWSEGFESEENAALLLTEGSETETSGSKREVADAVWDAVLGLR
ncbi:bifunctional phosphopantothenoylcysteine decarboxylase/phosphopantothenate--cysteine ligase CoaBC [Microbacterium sp. SORGH_AS_0862]|uniref:bifunctional phosphopantothenoylcysteine decarboxylase/phosphopantothenate--cysteine ligase CoaBC n=1 Tax=Microbacterium sp. SORGH_AS_0862 TaxID=3041789 RepID=UPI002792F9B7|nr:bifunctional phosphopantothenoylcysteine decarboxylase/phosphopantothenate--cysteine ligase CoaBC [Microbacterium sp. SORGH_AS_0862]MDQ1205571.1 phosphopantothenoylcysteine decarboxylase/phosphopantothenate--cysteine ligase [Microbacterium sp. SORGH_AS_0862]